MADTYIEMFEETYYPPAFLKTAVSTIQEFENNQEGITEKIKERLNQYLKDLIAMQEAHLAEPVAEITFSFLYTSLEEQEPVFRIDSYGEGGRIFRETILSEQMKAPWLTAGLAELKKELSESIARNSLGRYIRPAELEKLKLRAVRSLLLYFSSRFRYVMADVLDKKQLARVQKMDSFLIEMGEYQDWQKVLYAQLPEVDIFNCDRNTVLSFRRFSAIYYENKQFKERVINSARFTDCTFTGSVIENCQMNDCVFDGCTFENMFIRDTEMIGCLFIDCDFSHADFEQVTFFADSTKKTEDYYEPAEFYICGMVEVTFRHCDCSYCMLDDCDIEDLVMIYSKTEGSGFEEDPRVIWNEQAQEVTRDGVF